MNWPFYVSLAVFAVTLAMSALVAYGSRRIRYLRNQAPAAALPRLSIIIAACNEADTLEPALRSLLNLDYPDLEIIAVDDRSSDGTGAILERLAASQERLRVIHIESLPPGWLGKVHALHAASRAASGEYLLFTDADVVFAPDCPRRAVSHAEREGFDHLVVTPDFVTDNRLLRMMLVLFIAGMMVVFQPWRVRHARGRFVGVGAFNLVRARAYRALGGHAPLAMAPLDDLMLGKLMKRGGARADVLYGRGLLSVAWYRTPLEMVRGLGKNAFSGFDYSLAKLCAATAALLILTFWPPLALFLTDGITRSLNCASLATSLAMLGDTARRGGWGAGCLLYVFPAQLLTIYTWWRAALLALWRQGIEWRGTRYPLAEIKARHF